ncbi:MAG: hypothetical protein ACO3UL_07735 [Flavobacteriaceae bacterium]
MLPPLQWGRSMNECQWSYTDNKRTLTAPKPHMSSDGSKQTAVSNGRW